MRYCMYSFLAVSLFCVSISGCEFILNLQDIDPEKTQAQGGSTIQGGGGTTTTTTTDGGGGVATTSTEGGGGTTTTAPACMGDGVQNGDETDVDCGGVDCPQCALGKLCLVGTDCQSGTCADGVCCGAPCASPCQSCNQPDKLGICTAFPAEEDPENDCLDGVETCNGQGACKTVQGQPCSASAECLTGHCTDGFCCDTACAGLCVSCDQPTHEGTCRADPVGTDPADDCAADVCDGKGTCGPIGSNGATCLAGMVGACASGFCVDDICCSTACTQICTACSKELTTLPDGTCGAVEPGKDPKMQCTPPKVCVGNGMCALFP